MGGRVSAPASSVFAVVVEEPTPAPRLGTRTPVPVEVHPFGWRTALAPLRALGGVPELRRRDGETLRTDNGNYILDATFPPLRSPAKLAAAISAIPVVVEHGLFVGLADLVLAGTAKGVRTLRPTRRT